jgi:hypothetical protein
VETGIAFSQILSGKDDRQVRLRSNLEEHRERADQKRDDQQQLDAQHAEPRGHRHQE